MRILILALALLLLTMRPATGQCCGDCGGDGQVSISDLVTAVNNALGGCGGGPTPTPTVAAGTCPIDFNDDNTQPGTPDCYYRGRWNPSCGGADLETLWRSDGEFVVVDLLGFAPGLFFGAEVTGPGRAELICWYTDPDATDCEGDQLLSGAVTLGAAGGTLDVRPAESPFMLEQCDFTRYQGTLFEVDTPAAATAARLGRGTAAALVRLRAAAAARSPRTGFKRVPGAPRRLEKIVD